MDENRNRSIVLFLLMGVGLLVAILYAFVIGPRGNRNTLGSNNLVLDMPVNRRDLRYGTDAVFPFCSDGINYIGLEVTNGSSVVSSSDGIVKSLEGNRLIVEISSSYSIEYFPVSNYRFLRGDYVTVGDTLGRVNGNLLEVSVYNSRDRVYECPYVFMNSFSKSILDEVWDVLGYDGEYCLCESVE
jgi:hypothetical protein